MFMSSLVGNEKTFFTCMKEWKKKEKEIVYVNTNVTQRLIVYLYAKFMEKKIEFVLNSINMIND